MATDKIKSLARIYAVLCALVADYFALGATVTYGDPLEGLIVVPDKPLARG